MTDGACDHGEALSWEQAAALLDVPPAALRRWSERLAFPSDVGSSGTPRFRRAEIEALRDALPTSHSVSGAISTARRRSELTSC